MIGRAPHNIRVVRPLQGGVIADYEAAEKLLVTFIRRALGRRAYLHPRALICVPCEITEVERRAVEDAARRAGAREVSLIEKPFAAAAGAGLDLAANHASMIVTIGGGTTDVAVLSFGGLIQAATTRAGGMKRDQAIAQHLHKTRSMEVGETTAELIKLKLASASGEADQLVLEVGGRSLSSRLPVWLSVTSAEVSTAIEPVIRELISTVRNVIEELPPEVAADLLDSGIVLTGGGAQLQGLPERLHREIGLEVRLAGNSTLAAVLGAGRLLRPEGPEPEMNRQTMPGPASAGAVLIEVPGRH
jgi:rod shape-determining protein MreB